MKPPSLAASAAACAVMSSHSLKAGISSAVALELTMALTARSSSRICCPAVAAFVGLKPLSGFCLCWVIAWTSKAISVSSCSRVGGLVADFKDAADSLASSIGPPGSAREIAIPATNGAPPNTDPFLFGEVTLRRHDPPSSTEPLPQASLACFQARSHSGLGMKDVGRSGKASDGTPFALRNASHRPRHPLAARSQFWSQSSPFAGLRQHPTGPFVSVNRDVGISPYLGLRIWKASANELARHRFELAPLTRSYTRSNTSGRVHGRRSSTPEGATAEVSTCLNSCLTGV